MLFLEITVPPSVPAFLAIFLSQFSTQAEDTRKGERLKDIQIKKEINIAFINHYKVVRKELTELHNRIGKFAPTIPSYNVSIDQLDLRFVDEPFPVGVQKAMLHFIGETSSNSPNFLVDFKKSENNVDNINKNIDELKEKVIKFLRKNNQNKGVQIADSFSNKNGSLTEVFGYEVFCAVYRIWNDEQICSKTISELKKCISNSLPAVPTSLGDLTIYQQEIKYLNSSIIAKTNNFLSGKDVLALILKLLEENELKSECIKVASKRKSIEDLREEFRTKCNEIIYKIDQNKLLNVVKCCPFHEYKDDIVSYFENSDLYAMD